MNAVLWNISRNKERQKKDQLPWIYFPEQYVKLATAYKFSLLICPSDNILIIVGSIHPNFSFSPAIAINYTGNPIKWRSQLISITPAPIFFSIGGG
ncbi:hypothetical protein FHK94_12835 [Cylindrospermopsis raciborskii CS-506_D]|nr:hypothetical protein [Cylindrospermopsis raciborskii]MBA4450402.1 hypothetical protein [Cylindrospermopsis raciborskii CS-506_D]